jgi:hypothetical protein
MFQIGRAGDDQAALAPLLARFARWSVARAVAQTSTLIVVAIAVALGTWPMTSEETGTPPAPGPRPAALDRPAVRAEIQQARLDLHQLIGDATPADPARPSDGTRLTNQQLRFHVLLGYLIVRALLVLVRVFGLLPDGATTWDPFFAGYMTLADIYHYPTQHFRFHLRQLTLSPPGHPLRRAGFDRAERPAAAGKSPGRRGARGRPPAMAASSRATLPVVAEPIVQLTIDIAARLRLSSICSPTQRSIPRSTAQRPSGASCVGRRPADRVVAARADRRILSWRGHISSQAFRLRVYVGSMSTRQVAPTSGRVTRPLASWMSYRLVSPQVCTVMDPLMGSESPSGVAL